MSSIEAIESGEILNSDFQGVDNVCVSWNGRIISLGNVKHDPEVKTLSYFQSTYGYQEPASPLWGYFDSEAKKQNEFDVAVYQYHVRCNSEESKKALESAFERMALGMVGIVVGVIWMLPATFAGVTSGGMMIYNCSQKIWQGVDDFKRAIETKGVNLDDVRFVTWYEDLKRNSDEMTRNSILQLWKPLDQSGFELMDKQYDRKLLDPTFNPWAYA